MTDREALTTLINGGMIMDSWSYFYRIEGAGLYRYSDPDSEATRCLVRTMKAPVRIITPGRIEELLSDYTYLVDLNSAVYNNIKLLLDGRKLKFPSSITVKLEAGFITGNRVEKNYLRASIFGEEGRVIKERKSK